MFRPLSPGHNQVTRNWILRKLHTVIHKVIYMSLILSLCAYELQCVASSNFSFLWHDGLVIEAETCCHLITLNKINMYNASCVLTYKNFTPYRHIPFWPSRGKLKFAFTIYRRIGLQESFPAGAHRNVNVQSYWNLVRFFFSQPGKLAWYYVCLFVAVHFLASTVKNVNHCISNQMFILALLIWPLDAVRLRK